MSITLEMVRRLMKEKGLTKTQAYNLIIDRMGEHLLADLAARDEQRRRDELFNDLIWPLNH